MIPLDAADAYFNYELNYENENMYSPVKATLCNPKLKQIKAWLQQLLASGDCVLDNLSGWWQAVLN